MSEFTQPEAPTTPQPGAELTQNPSQPAQNPAQQTQPQPSSGEQEYPLRLVKRETGALHNVTGVGLVPVTHAETGEPETEYALVATIDGVDVTLASYNSGRIETIVHSQQQASEQQQPSTEV